MQYWLLKSEPDTFSIEDLANRAQQTEPWEGVRNYQARNYMRAMKKGDLAFFYHSSCAIPGIAGTVKIVKAATADLSAMDPESPYFDAKSTVDNPRWYVVHVKLVKLFKTIITLPELRTEKDLAEMVILRRGNRLSVTPVSREEWEIINSWR